MSATTTTEPRVASAVATAPHGDHITVIGPWRDGIRMQLEALWRYRKLIVFFGKKYLERRYRNTWLGWIWIPLRPGVDILSRALFFGGFLGAQGGDRPYIIFFTFGSCGWIVFERVNMWATRSMRLSVTFIKGAYIPRLPRLAGTLFPAALDFLLYVLVAVIAIFYYLLTKHKLYLVPSLHVFIACAGILLLVVWGITIGFWTSPFSAFTRDVRYSFGYITQFWYFVTPVAYPISQLPPKYQLIAEVNPITAPIEMVKYGFLGTAAPTTTSLISGFSGLPLLAVAGLWMFSRFEKTAVSRL
jgi:ABC-type polysaccharide/polyol phosphate export permease